MGFTAVLVVLATIVFVQCESQDSAAKISVTLATQSYSPLAEALEGTHSVSEGTTISGINAWNVNTTIDGVSTTAPPVWVTCTTGVQLEELGSDNIASVLNAWCQNYEKIIDCLSRDIAANAPDNPLDFFINLTFNKYTLRSKSEVICGNLKANVDRVSCADTANETLAGSCAAEFSVGMMHVFTLHKEKDLPKTILSEVACDVALQTTFCLRDTLLECEDDVQSVLLSYYSLFTNDSCIAKQRSPKQETVVSKCASEAAQTLSHEQSGPEPTSLLNFLILGLKTDCETFSARFACYRRELVNITNFRDFWLSLTFDNDNAVASQTVYCQQVNNHIIPGITSECFNKSQPGLAACEVSFGREVEVIREEWFKNPDFDGLQLQTLACRTSVTRAACLDNAMQPCGLEISRAMAISEIGILPDICRRLLTIKSSGKSGTNSHLDFGNDTEIGIINRTSTENQMVSNGTDLYNNKQINALQNEWSILDQSSANSSHEKSTDKILPKESDKNLTPNEATTSRPTNDTTEKGLRAGQKRKYGIQSSTPKDQANSPDNEATARTTSTSAMLFEIFLAVIVLCSFHL